MEPAPLTLIEGHLTKMATRDRALLQQFCSEAKEAEAEGDFAAAIRTYSEGTHLLL